MNHRNPIKRCIELAKKATGKTYPNPLVGAVIVHNDVIMKVWAPKAGGSSYEINAINSVKIQNFCQNLPIYVSFEPCAHFWKTPPASLKLKRNWF